MMALARSTRAVTAREFNLLLAARMSEIILGNRPR